MPPPNDKPAGLPMQQTAIEEMFAKAFSKLVSLHPRLKCLFMSGYTADVIAHQGVLEPGTQFLQKPFSIKELASVVQKTLDSKQGA